MMQNEKQNFKKDPVQHKQLYNTKKLQHYHKQKSQHLRTSHRRGSADFTAGSNRVAGRHIPTAGCGSEVQLACVSIRTAHAEVGAAARQRRAGDKLLRRELGAVEVVHRLQARQQATHQHKTRANIGKVNNVTNATKETAYGAKCKQQCHLFHELTCLNDSLASERT
jgi:hypothetical protein